MADWTPSSNSFVRPYRRANGSPYIRYFEPSTAATPIVVGDFVQFDTAVATSAHRIVRARSTGGGGGNLLGINGANLLGVAMTKDESDGSTSGLGNSRLKPKVGVAVFDGHTEFLGYTRWAGPVTSTMIGTTRSVIYDSTLKIWQVDSTNSTAALQTVVITDVPDAYIGDTGAPVIFKIALSTLVNASVKV